MHNSDKLIKYLNVKIMKKATILIIFVLMASMAWSQGKTVLSIKNVNTDKLKTGDHIAVQLFLESSEKRLSSFQMYLKYDQDVLTYKEIKNVNSLIKNSWFDNQTPNFIAALYFDNIQKGIHFEGKQLLCEVEFIYNGGETDIQWGTESKIVDGVMFMGITKFTNIEKTDIKPELINGCVCPAK